MNTKVLILMGSESDWTIMKDAHEMLKRLEIGVHAEIASAHRTPEKTKELAETARAKGIRVIIAGAGAAAHLPGVVAAFTDLPVIGVPIASTRCMRSARCRVESQSRPSRLTVRRMQRF